MKRLFSLILIAFSAFAVFACTERDDAEVDFTDPHDPGFTVSDPITAESPTPTVRIDKVDLTAKQKGYIAAGNAMAFKLMKAFYAENKYKEGFIFSPLSLQYVLAMTVNGAGGNTAKEITSTLGYGEDGADALNSYCKTLIEQMPAVDLDVTVKLADAIIVNDKYTLDPSFRETVMANYYAAVENMSFSNKEKVIERVNEWAYRNTNGLIYPLINDVNRSTAAILMNALYFKAPWADGFMSSNLFDPASTRNEDFHISGSKKAEVEMMRTMHFFPYVEKDGFRAVSVPYSNGKFAMQILLPDKVDGIESLLQQLPDINLSELLSEMDKSIYSTEVYLHLPKFSGNSEFELPEYLQALGIKDAFVAGKADFKKMFTSKSDDFVISRILQKARISVSEWGTEAAAVTVEYMAGATGIEYKKAEFYCDHPFVYIISERTSGAILFAGVYAGPDGA